MRVLASHATIVCCFGAFDQSMAYVQQPKGSHGHVQTAGPFSSFADER
jgi:hypothetical protein